MAYKKSTKPFLYINGIPVPMPKLGFSYTSTTTVDSARNANGAVTGSKVGRDQIKLNNLEWPVLDANTWGRLLREFEKFRLSVKYYDPVKQRWITRLMYPGDRTYTVNDINSNSEPTEYINCKCNLIDMGYGS